METTIQKPSDECLFCVKYLQEHGILSNNFDEIASLLNDIDADLEFDLVRVNTDYFHKLAVALRKIWPSGKKPGTTVSWVESENSTAKRLEILWRTRRLKKIPVDKVVQLASMYISDFNEDTKYMKTLKYFIYKHIKQGIDNKGKPYITCESNLADMIETVSINNIPDYEEDIIIDDMISISGGLV